MEPSYRFDYKKNISYSKLISRLFAFSLTFFLIYSFFCYFFILSSNKENTNSSEFFFNRPPDVIVVFTGDTGRIPYAIEQAKKFKQSNILITGVYSKNTVESLLRPLEDAADLDINQLSIDYTARNTIENAIATLRHLREHKTLFNVLIISHDYHLMRIKLTMNKLRTGHDDFEFFYSGIKTDYSKWRNLKILYKEVFKLFRAYIFLSFWDAEIITTESI
ncbi:MAG: hypothetical protein A2504_04055 [Bdellovibrionales bacterium RIFOXYD12_FULL_39_22]|nr:MAG: hypothetical protein A2385_11805 [Bdellovibrionales bacterium RIFOXYB1_FULL_39_21]OFZ41747.1 MAG: hypothetical protein A2485_02115 [Bdellovibrionales bacterium RIFOXYC12_FULL_39_17]OFZ46147.1 MAG: hypothetical protein A2404_12480 [Bdellovibrionales bacterium RIFOXYC1_FULL_39_130]OFZ74973.1 MAG: hypothetical protein A2560_15520 [Bdellovibrionales bacterium RIFOXYD1_FULL_39_84]OFZ76624.1 MAG: hypothetical protein A2451_13545 [Bdellovibrionales bacterium RIFOXYC2_FULL_39_8]OFZ92826.1 MAG: